MSENGRATFTVPVAEVCFEDAPAAGPGIRTVRGLAAVYNRLSHDLGGYRVKVNSAAFDQILDTNPDVHLLWDHNTRYVLARTKNKTLELRSVPMGLHVWARLAKTQTVDELATLMEGGYIDEMSFACDIGDSTWTEDEHGDIVREILTVDGLYDVTICAQGAFPQTGAQLVVSLDEARARADLEEAVRSGALDGTKLAAKAEQGPYLTLNETREKLGLGHLPEGAKAELISGRAAQEPADAKGESAAQEPADAIGHAAAEEPDVEDVANVGVPSLAAIKARAKARFAAVTSPK